MVGDREINEKSMRDVDVCIDFTSPKSVLGNAEKISKFRKNMVIGTTGWHDRIEEMRMIARKNNIGMYDNIFFIVFLITIKKD